MRASPATRASTFARAPVLERRIGISWVLGSVDRSPVPSPIMDRGRYEFRILGRGLSARDLRLSLLAGDRCSERSTQGVVAAKRRASRKPELKAPSM
jgi:hypothetical protein